MNIYLTIGNVSIAISRVILVALSCSTIWQWTLLTFGIHFLVMLGWIIEQKSTLNKSEKLNILSCLHTSLKYCLYFHYLKNGNLRWRRRFFHVLILLEGIALLVLYLMNNRHVVIVQAFGSGLVGLCFLIGVIFLEYDTYCFEKNKEKEKCANDEEQGRRKINPVDTVVGSSSKEDKNSSQNSSKDASTIKEPSFQVNERSSSNCGENDKELNTESFLPLGNNKRETMCSIQDLLANTSAMNSFYECEKNKISDELIRESPITVDSVARRSNCSINKVGLPIAENLGSSSSSSSNSFSKNSSREVERSNLSNFGITSNCNNGKVKGSCGSNDNSVDENKNAVETSIIMGQNIINTLSQSSSNNYDYENIYDAVPTEDTKVDADYTYVTPYPPKPLCLLQSANESIAAQSSGSHDYENIPALNVYRANTGVRHWSTYFDIEDRVHDYSTFKERSEIQDSTLASNLYTSNVIVTNVSNNRPYSLAEKVGSHYSISLPDLSNIVPAECIEVDELPNQEHEVDGKKNNKDILNEDSSNYEAIWYEDIKDDENPRTDNGPTLVIGKDGKIQESLCNLYYSRLSDLSSKYFAYGMKRNNSLSCVFPGTEEESRNFQLSKPQLLFEVNSTDIVSLTSTTSTPKGRKIESKRTQKSPLMKFVTLSQNSFHEHTAKALQAGKRVFYRPRIHVITPKKEASGIQRRASLKASATNDDSMSHFKVDPNILKKRSQLSPKDKLILSEASALIRKRKTTQSSNTNDESPKNTLSKRLPLTIETTEILDTPLEDDENGPQHSTPEGNRHLPQMSILSTISSVASPEDNLKLDMETLFNKKSSLSSFSDSSSLKRISSSRLLQNGRRCNSKILNEMSVIQEFEAIPSQV